VKLPELSAAAAPQFTDAASCKAWLENVPLANVAAAQQDLLAELEEFNRFPTAAANRLGVLEALREAVHFVQIEQAKRFLNRPLPMGGAEAAAFQDTIDLWEQMRLGYLRCLELALGGDAAMHAQAALVAQRLAAYCGLKMFHYYRAYREVPPSEWRALHEGYAAAERLAVAEEPVKDFLNRDVHDSSPRIAYARAVLMGMASPNELGQRQLTFVAFLLERWAAKLEVSAQPVAEGEGLPPLIADLAGERCPRRPEPGEPKPAEPRYLDTRKLAKTLRNRVGLLRKGESPAKLALGEDCVQPSCEQMLVFLFRQWCQAKPARGVERRRASDAAQVCIEFDAIHRHVSGGGGLRRPVEAKELTQQQRQELETLGHIRTSQQPEEREERVLEDWKIVDDSAQGLRIVRAAGSGGKRYAHGQLIAVRPGDGKGFILGQVRWLMGAANGELHAGVRFMPGIPAAMTVRAAGLNEKNVRALPALSLGAVAAARSPASLVLPLGSFKPERVFEIVGDKPANVRLTEVIERGVDFERVAYEPA
jgi:cyclic-di-GMP-binding protein